MRDAESLILDHPIPIQNQVEIERARGARVRTLASHLALDAEKDGQQIARHEGGVTDGHRIEEAGLLANADRRGVVKGGDAEIANRGRERVDRIEQEALAIA